MKGHKNSYTRNGEALSDYQKLKAHNAKIANSVKRARKKTDRRSPSFSRLEPPLSYQNNYNTVDNNSAVLVDSVLHSRIPLTDKKFESISQLIDGQVNARSKSQLVANDEPQVTPSPYSKLWGMGRT